MASTIQIKNSTTGGNSPSSLAQGEFAINVIDGNLFYGDGSNVKQDFAFGDITGSNAVLSGTLTLPGIADVSASIASVVGESGADWNTNLLNIPAGLVSGSSQVVLQNANKTGFTGASSITTLGTIGTGVWQGTAIADAYISSATTWNNKLDSSGTIATNDYAKFDASGDLVGRSYVEVKTDLSLNNVENTALSTYTGNGGALDNQYITNGAGYTTNTGTVTSVGGTGTVSGLSLSGTVTTSGNLTLGGTISISSTNITDVDAFSQSGTYASLRAQGTTKGDVGLGNVENTALSTWAGSSNLTTLGTVTSGNINAILPSGLVSGSSQININSTTGTLTTLGTVTSGDISAILPTGTVSGSSQIAIGSTTGTITSAKISDVDAFSQSGTYASLRAQGTTKGDVGLGNVENTALSTWAGSSNLVTLGTVTSGNINALLPSGLVSGSSQIVLQNANKTGFTGASSITTLGTIGTGVWQGTAIADGYISSATTWNNKLDSSGTITTNDYAKFDASGDLVGRSYSEVKTDLSLNNVENTALSTYTGNGGALDNQYITNGAGYTTNTGTVDTSGTPANDQLAIFTDSNTIEGNSSLTFDGFTLSVGQASISSKTGVNSYLNPLITSGGLEVYSGNSNFGYNGTTSVTINGKTGVIDTSGDVTGSDVYIDGWGSVSASLAAASGGGGISFNGSTANGVVTYGGATTADVESKLTFNSSILQINATNTDSAYVRIGGSTYGPSSPYIEPSGLYSSLWFGSTATGKVFDMRNNKLSFDADSTNTYIWADTSNPENLEIHADGNIELRADNNLEVYSNITGSATNILLTQPDLGGGAGNYLKSSGDIFGGTFLFKLGDIDDNYNGTKIIIDDANGKVSIPTGKLELGAVTDVEDRISSYRTQIVSNGFYSQNTLRYLTFNTTGETTGFNYLSLMPAPANGRVISISVWNQSGGGSTVMGFHKNSNATPSATDTQTLTLGVPVTFTFSSGNTFSQNDELSFSIDPTGTPNGLFFSIILEYDY